MVAHWWFSCHDSLHSLSLLSPHCRCWFTTSFSLFKSPIGTWQSSLIMITWCSLDSLYHICLARRFLFQMQVSLRLDLTISKPFLSTVLHRLNWWQVRCRLFDYFCQGHAYWSFDHPFISEYSCQFLFWTCCCYPCTYHCTQHTEEISDARSWWAVLGRKFWAQQLRKQGNISSASPIHWSKGFARESKALFTVRWTFFISPTGDQSLFL